jgi:UPF0271 protein
LRFTDGMQLDLNCDLGEGEPFARTRALMRHATSVNVACGVHAGDAATMERCVQLTQKLGVRIGAHPGVAGAFGRAEVKLTGNEFQTLLLQQVGALHRLTEVHRVRLHHVKLHGSLYHAVERNVELGRCYVETLGRWFGGLRIYARAGGQVAALGRKLGVAVWEEAFADRAYRPDGSLVAREEPGALLTRPAEITRRVHELRAGRGILAMDGYRLPLRVRTICVHGDTPGAIRLLGAASRALAGPGKAG